MPEQRPVPWTDLFEAIGEERFTQIRNALSAGKVDAEDRDAFLLNGAAGQLLRELMPQEAPAEAISTYGALIHMVYLAWAAGWPVTSVAEDALRASLAAAPALPAPALPRLCYVQLPPNVVWAEPEPGQAHEPLDGAFVLVREDRVHVLAVLGFRAGRPGFTSMEGAIRLPAPFPGARTGGQPAFASALPGGEAARLISLVDEHELCALMLLALWTNRVQS